MNRLGIMVDVSHLSDDAVRDVLRITDVPVIASHSGMRHFTPGFERNLSDELARAIAAEGGVVQIVFGSAFIDARAAADTAGVLPRRGGLRPRQRGGGRGRQAGAQRGRRSTRSGRRRTRRCRRKLDAVLDQIDHAVKVMGIDHVGIGSDFDGVSGKLPEGLRTVADYPNLVAGLQARGYTEADIRKILGGNLLRVWRAVEAAAKR